jgi:glutaredoxin
MPRVSILLIISVLLLASAAISPAAESVAAPDKQTLIRSKEEKAPLVVIYTLSTCPHCREAKDYLNNNKIPFVNREVDANDEYMDTLMKIYEAMGVPEEKRGVPLIVIGNKIKIQGFNKDKLQSALKELTAK